MRFSLTEPERKLWEAIRGQKLGVRFRRQVPFAGRYIGDFVASAVRLVVEVDGAHHERQRQADDRHDRMLGRLGYRVLRLEAEVVLRRLPEAVERIRAALGQSR